MVLNPFPEHTSYTSGPMFRWKPVRRDLLPDFLSLSLPLDIEAKVAYVEVKAGSPAKPTPGWFLLDTGTTHSIMDRNYLPTIQNYSHYYPESFHFFKFWQNTIFSVSDFSEIRAGVVQSGIIGTDFLANARYAFDYKNLTVSLSEFDKNYSDELLAEAGLEAMDTSGYFSSLTTMKRSSIGAFLAPNVPTVEARIGSAHFSMQVDSGYNDWKRPFSININAPLKKLLDASGIELIPEPSLNGFISTCVPGVKDKIMGYRLPANAAFALLNLKKEDINQYQDIHVFLKHTCPEAKVCGGISSWGIPGAQLGASFLKNAGFVILDGKASRIWLPKSELR